MKQVENRITLIKIILVMIFILYLWFLYRDFYEAKGYELTRIIKYLSIVFCFLLSLLTGENVINKKDIILLRLGLFFTVLADLSLVILGYINLGLIFFCLVQIIYSIRYDVKNTHNTPINLIISLLFILSVYLIVNLFLLKVDTLIPIVLFYSIALITNVISSIKINSSKVYPCKNKLMIACGMILFLLCDINVALYNVSQINIIIDICHLLIWFFYLPSQVLLALSGYDFKV